MWDCKGARVTGIERLQTTNRCENVTCQCDSDCESGTCFYYPKVSQGKCVNQKRSEMMCNETQSLCADSTFTDNYYQTINRCLNIPCQFDAQCKSNMCYFTCQNEKPSNLKGCNNSMYMYYFNNNKWYQGDLASNICAGYPCLCDNQCTKGTYCDAVKYKCMQGSRRSIACNESDVLCTLDFSLQSQVNFTYTLDRCLETKCSCDSECLSGYCDPELFRCSDFIPLSKRGSCNKSASLCGSPTSNRCLQTKCECDNECESGLCDTFQQNCAMRNASITCEKRMYICETNYSTNTVDRRLSNNKCAFASCMCDEECHSGYCSGQFDGEYGFCSSNEVQCNQTSERKCSSINQGFRFPFNLCNEVDCKWDGDCQSGFCNNGKCEHEHNLLVSGCNKTEQFSISRNYITGEVKNVSSSNRCLGSICTIDSQCVSYNCLSGQCADCNSGKDESNLCPFQDCEFNFECASKVCKDFQCYPINSCNSTLLLNPMIETTNRCLGLACLKDSDCQSIANCKNQKCTLQIVYTFYTEEPVWNLGNKVYLWIAVSVAIVMTLLFMYSLIKYYYKRRTARVSINIQRRDFNNTTESNINNATDSDLKALKQPDKLEKQSNRHSQQQAFEKSTLFNFD
ncbi:hypothetical protein FGO68_gene16930 [Halteria grandinella]|uniref:Uncharacterized protein n=1 Tax=Halteria grandinella TaxID=5974 RepID=A0A8J8P130_HALGN|nr:hypothetical protein FGO68_gene16930 [Halteria grandinella]